MGILSVRRAFALWKADGETARESTVTEAERSRRDSVGRRVLATVDSDAGSRPPELDWATDFTWSCRTVTSPWSTSLEAFTSGTDSVHGSAAVGIPAFCIARTKEGDRVSCGFVAVFGDRAGRELGTNTGMGLGSRGAAGGVGSVYACGVYACEVAVRARGGYPDEELPEVWDEPWIG